MHEANLVKTIKEAVNESVAAGEAVLVCGSFFIMQDAREVLGFEDEQDLREVNKD